MKKIRWGILSTAKIGVEKVIPALQKSVYGTVNAIASRDAKKARSVADRLGINKSYGTYHELLDDPEIDAIYNPLPNALHLEWTLKAMEAGKHVLCEKPLALTVEDVENLIRSRDRNGVKAGEAFMVKSNPQWIQTRERIRAGEIGQLGLILGAFSYYNSDPSNIRNIQELGGGGIWDIGCYPVTSSRYIFEEEPTRVVASLEFDPKMKTDRLGSVIMEFPSGQAIFSVSTQMVPYQRMSFFGTTGRLEIRIPFNAPTDRPNEVLYDPGDMHQEEIIIRQYPSADQYGCMGDDFARAILEDSEVPVPFEDSLMNTKVLTAIFESAANRAWVELT